MKRFSLLVTLVAALFLVIAACNGDDEDVAEPADDTDVTEEVDDSDDDATDDTAATDDAADDAVATDDEEVDAEEVVIQFLTIDTEEQLIALEQMTEAFRNSDPRFANVEINFRAVPFAELFPLIESAVAAGADMDMFLADGPDIKHYAYNGAIIPLGEHFSDEELDQWVPQSVDEGSFGGQLYAPPIMQSCSMMYYNADMTDEAGLSPPAELDGWTMDEAWDAWEATTVDVSGDGSPDQWGIRWGQGVWWGDYEQGIPRRSAGERGSPTFQGIGDDGITFQGYFDTDEAISAFQDMRDWHHGERAVTPVEPIPEIFVSERAAFQISPDNLIGQIARVHPDGDFNFGVTGIPYYEDGAQLCHTGSWHFGVSPQTEHEEISIEIARFFASEEGSQIWYNEVRQLPAHVELLNTLPEYNEYPQQLHADGLQTIGEPRIPTPGYTEYQQIFAEMMQNVAQGTTVEVETLVRDAAMQMEQSLQRYDGWQDME